MTSDDSGGLTVDLKLFKQLIKKKCCEPNWLQIAINALCNLGPGENHPASLSKCTPAGVSL